MLDGNKKSRNMLHGHAEVLASEEASYSNHVVAFRIAVARVFRPGDFPRRFKISFPLTGKAFQEIW